MLLNIIQFFIIKNRIKTEEKYKNFLEHKIIFPIIDTIENTTRIQKYFKDAASENKISISSLEQIARWYDTMYMYSDNIRRIYNIYKEENKNYSLTDVNYFMKKVYVIRDIIDKEYENNNFNGYIYIDKYENQFKELIAFNSLFIESLKQSDIIEYVNGRYWIKAKFADDHIYNNNLFIDNFFYWNVFNDFFKLLEKEDFRNLYEIEED